MRPGPARVARASRGVRLARPCGRCAVWSHAPCTRCPPWSPSRLPSPPHSLAGAGAAARSLTRWGGGRPRGARSGRARASEDLGTFPSFLLSFPGSSHLARSAPPGPRAGRGPAAHAESAPRTTDRRGGIAETGERVEATARKQRTLQTTHRRGLGADVRPRSGGLDRAAPPEGRRQVKVWTMRGFTYCMRRKRAACASAARSGDSLCALGRLSSRASSRFYEAGAGDYNYSRVEAIRG